MGSTRARTHEYSLAFPPEVERRFRRCRASTRAAISQRLQDIISAAGRSRARSYRIGSQEPPLRFYVYEGFRVVYQVDPGTRRVIVLDIAAVPS